MTAAVGKARAADAAGQRLANPHRGGAAWRRKTLWVAIAVAGLLGGAGGCARSAPEEHPAETDQPASAAVGDSAPAAAGASAESVAEWIAEGQRLADELAEAFPHQPFALDAAARFHQRAGDPSKATLLWQRYLGLEPGSAYACFCLGSAAWERGDFEEAVGYLKKALALDPTLPNAPVVLAESLMQLGQPAEALSALENADRADPQFMRWFLMGQACLLLGRYQQARQHLEKAVAMEPRFAKAHYALVTACMRLGETAKAEEHRALFLKYLREAAGEPSPARAMGRDVQADEVQRLLAELAAGAAQCYALAGRAEPAQRWLARAMQLDPRHPACRRAAEAMRSAAAAPGQAPSP